MNKNQKFIIRSHTRIAASLKGMAQAVWNKGKQASDHEKELAAYFWTAALDHLRAASLTGDQYIIVR